MSTYETLRAFAFASYSLRSNPAAKAEVVKLLQYAGAAREGTAAKRKLDRKVESMVLLLAEEMGRLCQACPDLGKLLEPCRDSASKLKAYSLWSDARVLQDLKDCMSESD